MPEPAWAFTFTVNIMKAKVQITIGVMIDIAKILYVIAAFLITLLL